ncbi:HTTM domain-containing protein [Mycolicibacterium sp. 018/SC-01/001]|uniref:HTTM domain-containing protein n=1 Tax=Mycolicibacterium sp. 018/SC-01/001 TaxID=2592069 RepID=UPI00163DC79A|nr:HTTM domain-containing protein [Mycolicibacterium sp. 018/SC-01/001]
MTIHVDRARTAWLTFWFHPQPMYVLGMVRIVFGVLIVAWTLSFRTDLTDFFTSKGVVAQPRSDAFEWNIFHHVSDTTVSIGWWVLLLAGIALTLGWHSRLAALAVFVLVLSFQYRNPLVFNAGDVLVRVEALVIALAPAGAALSLDERRRYGSFWSAQSRAPWPLRLLQIQLTIIYTATFVARLTGEKWPDGTALSYAFRLEDMLIIRVPRLISENPLLMNVGTWAVLVAEVLIGILIWFRRFRRVVATIGVTLHLAIMATIAVGFFSPAMLVLYLAFLPAETATRWVSRRNSPRPSQQDAAGT